MVASCATNTEMSLTCFLNPCQVLNSVAYYRSSSSGNVLIEKPPLSISKRSVRRHSPLSAAIAAGGPRFRFLLRWKFVDENVLPELGVFEVRAASGGGGIRFILATMSSKGFSHFTNSVVDQDLCLVIPDKSVAEMEAYGPLPTVETTS